MRLAVLLLLYCCIENLWIPKDLFSGFQLRPVGGGLWCAYCEFYWALLRLWIINACLPPPDCSIIYGRRSWKQQLCPDWIFILCLRHTGLENSRLDYMQLSWEVHALLAWHCLTGERICWSFLARNFRDSKKLLNLVLRSLKCATQYKNTFWYFLFQNVT